MYKKLFSALIIVMLAFLLSCSNNRQNSPESTLPGEISAAADKFSIQMDVEKSTLSLGEKTAVNIVAGSGEEYSVDIQAVYGSILSEEGRVEYTAPDEMPPEYVDTITANFVLGDETYTKEANVLVLNDDLAGQWISTGGPDGGDISLIEVDKNTEGVMYAAGSGSRIFKSIDNGETWRGLIVDPESFSGKFYGIKIAPDDSNTVYAIYNNALFISRDAGATWENLIQGDVLAIDVNANIPGMLLVAMGNGQARLSHDYGKSFINISGNLPDEPISKCIAVSGTEFWIGTKTGGNGRAYKTVDAGESWRMADLDYPDDADVHSLYADPGNTGVVYVSFNDTNNIMLSERGPQFLQKTTDGGQTWTRIALPMTDSMISILGKSENGTLFVSTGGMVFRSADDGDSWVRIASDWVNGDPIDIGFAVTNPASVYIPTARSGIIKSEDNGETWDLKTQGLDNLKISLLVTPLTEQGQTVYVSSVGGEGLFKTQDFGRNWDNVIMGTMIHPWGDELQINPFDPNEIWYVADVGAVYVTRDGGQSWALWYDPTNDRPDESKKNGFRFSSIYAFAIAPTDPDIMYSVKSGFGIFKTTDGGNSWRFLNYSEVDYTYTLAIHPQNPDIVYSGYNPKPFQDFAMVRKTADGGETWETILEVEGSEGITSVCIDPANPDTVYAGSTGDDAGLWVSRNAGADWNRLYSPLNFTNVHTMAADPGRPDIAYAGVWGGGTYRTVDKGESWTRLENDPTDSAIAIMPDSQDSDVLYIADRTAPKVYRSGDDGKSWTTYFDAGDEYYRVLSAAISDCDPSVMYVSVLKSGSPFAGAFFRIENGNAELVGDGMDRIPVSIGVDPEDSDHIIVVSHAGGVSESKDGGHSWVSISDNCDGLPDKSSMSYNKVVFDPADPDTIYLLGGGDVVTTALQPSGISAGTVNTVYRSADGGKSWSNLNDGNLGENSGSIKGIAFTGDGILLLGCTNGVFQSSDNGATWRDVSGNIACRCTAGLEMSADGETFYAPMLGEGVFAGNMKQGELAWQESSALRVPIHHVLVNVDPSNPDIIYASAYPGGIFKSTDGGESFSENNFGLPSFSVDDPLRQGYYAFQIAPSDPDILYLGIYGKGVYISRDGASTWIAVNGADNTLQSKGIYSLAIDPDDPSVVTVSAEEGVFRTQNAGESWELWSEGMPDQLQVRTLAISPDRQLYAGTLGYGMYSTPSGNNQWSQMNALAQFGVFWPIWNDRPLYQYTSLLFNENDRDVIVFGTFPSGIYRSADGGETWRECNVGFTNDGVFYLTYHPDNDQIIYAGTYNGVNRSTDQGLTWEKWDEGWPQEQWVFSIDFDPNDPDTMYACSKNGENEGLGTEDFGGTVMKSTDGGQNWFPITNGLDCSEEFYKILVDHYDSSILYLASEWDGVFISRNAGASWEPWNDGLTNKIAGVNGNNVTNTMLISPDGNLIYFGTAGDGVYRRVTETVAQMWGE